ncbi:SRPBCC domain-containing protein [Nioella sp. MMSF_3534]|uniref:SRPBCC family protein n=1 Tax=Nioella sp. MMSF_3534 TaxID=3046720 RepID=UPI0027400CCC|nr:SRPBCC domain-containing protein [Nioella sp. MMSF_3534]
MADLTLTRHFAANPERVFEAISRPEVLVQWWGPEGLRVEPDTLDFTRLGPWGSVMINADGARYKVTGQVTHVDPPRSVGFTWAWHDDTDTRGPESHVTFTVEPDGSGGTVFRLSHVDLADEDAVANHNTGWSSSLTKLDALFAA